MTDSRVYELRAQQHRPQYREQFAAAACDLAAQGLRGADIAAALGVSEAAVRSLLSGGAYAYRDLPTEAM
jgi:DNA-directed RNA polymerase specialized sigma24 family protein